jgi:internalin A
MSELALKRIAENKKTRSSFINLSDCNIEVIPEEIRELKWIERLLLIGSPADLSPLSELTNLQQLCISNSSVKNLSPISNLKNLFHIEARHTLVTDLSPLSGLNNLQRIDISHTSVNDLSPISGLKNLQSLTIWGTKIIDLSPLRYLFNLQELNAIATPIADFSQLSHLKNLQHLNISHTTVNDLSSLSGLINLKIIYITGTPVVDLSPLSGLINLQQLDIWNTSVVDLSPLVGLKNIKQLIVAHTQVTNLSPLFNLVNLDLLNISNTQVTDLSPIHGLIEKGVTVKWSSQHNEPNGIYVENCPLVNPSVEIVKQGNEAILKYFDEIAHKHTFHNTEIKYILVGNSTAGKTSLVDFLTKKQYQSGKSSTHGILSNRWQTEFSGQELIVNIWDFGGQEYYHATHRLFLSQNAVYCLVWDAQTNQGGTCSTEVFYDDDPNNPYTEEMEHYPVQWWLRNVQHFTSSNQQLAVPLLMVQNKTERDGEQNISDQARDFNIEYGFYNHHISIEQAAQPTKKWLNRFEEFEEKLLQTLHDKCTQYKLPVYCRDVRNEINELKKTKKWLLRTDYEALCRNYDPTAAIDLIDIYLRDITGEILFYPNNNQLKDRVFLDSAWVCTQIYKVLSRDVRNKNFGVFDIDWVKTTLAVDTDEAARFLALMREFELIFEETDEDGNKTGQFIAPQYLPETCTDPSKREGLLEAAEPQHAFTLWFRDFLPKSVMARFIAKHGLAAQKRLYWKNGLCFKIAGCHAFVERTEGNKIKVNIQAIENKNTAAQRIFNTFLTIEEGSPNFAVSVNQQQFVSYRDLQDAFRQDAQRVKTLSETGKSTVNLIPIESFALFNPTVMKEDKPLKIFISYSKHDRENFLVPMLRYLKPLARGGLIETWDDSKILPGEEWDDKIKTEIDNADVIFLLVSVNSLNTDYIWSVEIEAAMRRHEQGTARVIPIILSKCRWEQKDRNGDYIFPPAKLNALPSKGKPIDDWERQNDAWDAVATGIEAILSQ